MCPLDGSTIVFVNNFPGPTYGGGEVRMLSFVEGCLGAGMYVHVICQPGSGVEREARRLGATVAPYRLRKRDFVRTPSRIRKYAKRYAADFLHGTGFLTNMLVRLAGGPMGTIVLNTGSCEPDAARMAGASDLEQWFRDMAETSTRAWLDCYVAVSQAIADKLVAIGIPHEKLTVIPSAVDVNALLATAEADAGIELPPSVGERPHLIGMVARLEHVKGVDVFLDAVGQLVRERDDVGFVVTGDGSRRAEFEARAHERGVADRVAFTGPVAPVASLIARFDVLAVPSRSEGLGTAAMEAGALGVPVVASDVGGLPEVVRHDVTGLLVPPDAPSDLAEALGFLLDEPTLRAQMGGAARRRIAERFSKETMVAMHLDLYRRLLALK